MLLFDNLSSHVQSSDKSGTKCPRFKDLTINHIVSEAISLKHAKKHGLTKKRSGAYGEVLDEVFNNKNRLIFPFTIDYSNLSVQHPIFKKIDELLDKHGYTIGNMKNYIDGMATKYKYREDGGMILDSKNPVKIGKLLQKYEEDGKIEVTDRKDGKKTTKTVVGKPLLHEFKNDPIRAFNGEFLIVISRHPYDVAGASTDRSWTSCMDLGLPRINYPNTKQNDGINRKYIPKDIEEGTLVAYVVTKDELFKGGGGEDKVKLEKPLSRILIKPHNSDVGKVYSIGKKYGAPYPEFTMKVKEWVSKSLNDKIRLASKIPKVYKNPRLYNDGDDPVDFEFNTGNEVADGVINDALNNNNEKELGNQITFETTMGRLSVEFEIHVDIDFEKDIVKPFDDLTDMYQSSISRIESKIEKMVATAIFKQLTGSQYVGPSITVDSTGEGIEITINFIIQTQGEEDKYVDEDYIWDTLYYGTEWLKNFDYKELKNNLYTIISTYDWNEHENDKNNAITKSLQNYREGLGSMLNSNVALHLLKPLQPITPENLLKTGTENINLYYKNIINARRELTIIQNKIQAFEQTMPMSLRRHENYTRQKHVIFDEWIKKHAVDLGKFIKFTDSSWSAKILIDLSNQNKYDKEDIETLKDIYHEINLMERYIIFLIGDDQTDVKI
jgi:hypothetical protein